VTKPHQLGRSVSKFRLVSFACRFSFCSASRFICGAEHSEQALLSRPTEKMKVNQLQ